MFENYVIIALRNLFRNRLYSAINIGGIAVGVAAALITVLYVTEELSYDRWIPDHERLYRLETTYNFPGRAPQRLSSTMMPAKTFLEADFAGIEMAARLQDSGISLTFGDTMFSENATFIDPEFLTMIDAKLVEGTLDGALDAPTEVILTRSVKEKYFADRPALGQTVIVDGDVPYTIVAVIEDIPTNSHLVLGVIAPLSAPNFYWRDAVDTRWDRSTVNTYVKLTPGTDPDDLESGLDDFVDRHVPTISVTGVEIEGTSLIELSLRPVSDIYLYSDSPDEMKPGGDPETLMGMTISVLLLLVIGAINYMNLATARYVKRTREVAMRKILGASRRQVMLQFLGESVLFALLAVILALPLVEIALPFFNSFVGKELALIDANWPVTAAMLVAIAVVIGLAVGCYPALVVSRMRPVAGLDGRDRANGMASFLREGLIILQFAASIGLVISAAVVFSQNRFASNLELGYEHSNLVVLRNVNRGPDENERIHTLLKNNLLEGPGIISVSGSSNVPSDPKFSSITIANLSGSNADRPIESTVVSVALDFFSTYAIAPLAGRTFSEEFGADRMRTSDTDDSLFVGGLVLNQTAARQLGLSPDEVVGQTIALLASGSADRYETIVVGVIPDFHLRSARNNIEPAVFYSAPAAFDNVTVRIGEHSKAETLAFIDETWERTFPDQNIAREFLDESVLAQYITERRQRTILTVAAILATLVAGVGLFGLAAFAAERRTREIGIRKVLGAQVADIVGLLTWQFLRPVLWANLIAWPAAWFFAHDWLSGFAYRIDLELWLFGIAGAGSLLIAWVTVSSHALRAARTHPVHALRYE